MKDENEKHNALAIDTATEDQMGRLDHQQKLPAEEEKDEGEGDESDVEMENEEFEKPADEDKKKVSVKPYDEKICTLQFPFT